MYSYLQYLGEEGNTIRGLHITPVMSFVDKLNFTLNDASDGTCLVKVLFYFQMCNIIARQDQVEVHTRIQYPFLHSRSDGFIEVYLRYVTTM